MNLFYFLGLMKICAIGGKVNILPIAVFSLNVGAYE